MSGETMSDMEKAQPAMAPPEARIRPEAQAAPIALNQEEVEAMAKGGAETEKVVARLRRQPRPAGAKAAPAAESEAHAVRLGEQGKAQAPEKVSIEAVAGEKAAPTERPPNG